MEMNNLMLAGNREHLGQALLFAVFVQLYSFTAYVNINLHVPLYCRHFSFQWKSAAAVSGIKTTRLP